MNNETEKYYEIETSEDGITWQHSRLCRTIRVAKSFARCRYHNHMLVRVNRIEHTPGADIIRYHYETLGYERFA